MRLVNVESLRLELFYGDPTEPYAVLSHTWGKEDEELSFQNMQHLEAQDTARRAKLDGTCAQARKDGFKYVWIDTCCIDKTNAVELSEAITSMFRWYKKSRMCYTILSDIGEGQTDRISKSRWFTRGWTLQELLASPRMTFFDSTWKVLGTKPSLSGPIMAATQIPHYILTGIASLDSASIAQKFSWASTRTTTRPEDMAYCLLGIFNIVIPPLYGEGLTAAFERLQEAIMRNTHDDSILAWGLADGSDVQPSKDKGLPAVSGGILAASPSVFKGCGDIIQRGQTETRIRVSETIWGTIPISICFQADDNTSTFTHGYLSCGPRRDPSKVIAVPLVRCSEETGGFRGSPVFLRPRDSNTVCLVKPGPNRTLEAILARKDRAPDPVHTELKSYWFYLPGPYPLNTGIEEVYPAQSYEEETAMIRTSSDSVDKSAVFLIRFSYKPPTMSRVQRYLLGLEFYKESALGGRLPRASLYFDDPSDRPVPLSKVSEMWSSLSLSGTSEIHLSNELMAIEVRVSEDKIAGQPLWVVKLDENNKHRRSIRLIPRGWPNISDQIRLRTQGIALLQHLREGAALTDQFDRLESDRERVIQEESTILRDLSTVRAKIKALEVEAQRLEDGLKVIDQERTKVADSIDNYNTVIHKFAETQKTIPPDGWLSVGRGTKYHGYEWERVRRLENEGIVAHMMKFHPLIREGKKLVWVPGMTLLMYAAATGHKFLVNMALSYDDDIEAKDADGQTVFDWARFSDGDPSAVISILDEHRSQKDQSNAVENQDTKPRIVEEEKRVLQSRRPPRLSIPGPGRSSPHLPLDSPPPSPRKVVGEKPPGQAQDPQATARPPSRKPKSAPRLHT
ncbi:heterokaryon incompatibility protein-domain-containing protein [Rhypophila decipiens]|uniref:Heterokaryon incompatibility protein-domain-containing protein n=1 Tax=Rhypophila decipiens TaxID=261697 RepID=A0AAN6Y213_9PEZI|nr:heterokaryon incompatibility protein-domain-containing protein [Rhypophila decipiens]